jgi:hypothetical protein
MKKTLLIIFPWLFVLKLVASDTTMLKTLNNIDGSFKCGVETICFNSKKNTFYLIRSSPKVQDAVIPLCYDTIAKGGFRVISSDVITLISDKNFRKIKFDVRQEKKLSGDSLYFKIVLPHDDAFFPGRFRYFITTSCQIGSGKSDSTFIAIPKSSNYCQSRFLNLLVQDLSPIWCIEEEKCYQRAFFRIFSSWEFDEQNNYFTITLSNFDECFVERMDVDKDLIYFNGKGSVLWRGKEYKKVR